MCIRDRVTLNPAKLLHIDDRVGSIKIGKDADLVLWTDHPLSIYAKAEKTIIEGVTYFDLERDKQLRATIKKERANLITMMLQDKNKGLKTQPVKKTDAAVSPRRQQHHGLLYAAQWAVVPERDHHRGIGRVGAVHLKRCARLQDVTQQ